MPGYPASHRAPTGGLVGLNTDSFAQRIGAEGAGRACLWLDPQSRTVRSSHGWLDELAEFLLEPSSGFCAHEALFLGVGSGTGALFGAFLHCTVRGQAQGGVRQGCYARLGDFLRDGLRLSQTMTRKNALAGLWWGGGKGLIASRRTNRHHERRYRRALYAEYGDFVTSLRGCYVTAEDAGTTPSDMAEVFRRTRFATCVPPDLGGSGNPSRATARGVICAMEAALDHLEMGPLAGKAIALQGAGQVGSALIELLLEKAVGEIVASEVGTERVRALRQRFGGHRVTFQEVEPGDLSILEAPCDVLAPNALGGVLGPETIPRVQAKIVCGAANNPLLEDVRDARALAGRGIVYVPDLVCNRMGIVHCADEQFGHLWPDPRIEDHLGREGDHSIYALTRRILTRADGDPCTPLEIAQLLADQMAAQPHPLFGTRAQRIVRSVTREWAGGSGA
jgi:glutamate dehydrogenase/leucine dehydrogenase